jgi:hypothetical protein
MAGIDCFVDAVPEDDMVGCLNSANLTNHETGLMNRSDDEIKDMFLHGVRPNGEALFPFMPYFSYANMSDRDADAIVAFLRTIPGVDHQVPPNQVPFTPPAAPASPIDVDLIPMPSEDAADYDSAMRGRYLAGQVGAGAILAIGLFHFFYAWNDFFEPLVFLISSRDKLPISVGLYQFLGIYDTNIPLVLAGAFIAMAFPLLVFITLQRVFQSGIDLSGSLK